MGRITYNGDDRLGSLGLLFVAEDWLVRVIDSYGLINILSYHISIWTITLSGFMYMRSHQTPNNCGNLASQLNDQHD